MEQESEPQQRSLANSTASFIKRAGSARVPGSATSCSTPHQFSVSVLACAPQHTPSLSLSASSLGPLKGPGHIRHGSTGYAKEQCAPAEAHGHASKLSGQRPQLRVHL